MIKFFQKIQKDPQFKLYELLKLKKSLESKFFRGVNALDNGEIALRAKGYILTGSIAFLYKSRLEDIRTIITRYLDSHFQEFKREGDPFVIYGLAFIQKEVPFFTELISFNTQLREHRANLIIQGSYADGTFINYSDIDLVIVGVLSEEVRDIKNQIDKFLLTLDPLQHHGAFFIHKDSFANYWQMDLPIDTLKKSFLLSPDASLEINLSCSFIEKYSAYFWLSNFINGYRQMPLNVNSGAFFSKYFLSQLMLVPALLLAFQGKYLYKKDSFTIAQKQYSPTAWKCMEIASGMREQWDQGNISHKYSTDRESAVITKVEEYNTLPDVINVEGFSFEEFEKSYDSFIHETDQLINGL